MHKVAGKISLLILAGLICLGQTRVSLGQLQGVGTVPRLVWSRGFRGQRVRLGQVKAARAELVTLSPAGRSFTILGEAPCSGAIRTGKTALLEVGWLRGRVVVLAGFNNADGYVPTRDVVEGDCELADFEGGRYPKGLNGLLYFGVYGMPTERARYLKGVAIDEAPVSYSMDTSGFTSVTLVSGKTIKLEVSK